tara:strand:+ start:21853 stop:22026 length:174 start_codon:yes stop_codon:yes gene_type:complete
MAAPDTSAHRPITCIRPAPAAPGHIRAWSHLDRSRASRAGTPHGAMAGPAKANYFDI